MNLRTYAKITGWTLIVMAIISAISIGYAYQEVFKVFQSENLINTSIIATNFKILLSGIFLIIILDLVVSYSLYRFFLPDNKQISTVSAIFRVIYTLIFAFAFWFLLTSYSILTNKVAVFDNFNKFQYYWNIGLIIFGLHLIGIGILMRLHKKMPSYFGLITIFAGLSYTLYHLLKVVNPSAEQLLDIMQKVLMLPMIAGELILAIWLVVKGGKTK